MVCSHTNCKAVCCCKHGVHRGTALALTVWMPSGFILLLQPLWFSERVKEKKLAGS